MLLKERGRLSETRIEYLLDGTERRTHIITNDYNGITLTLDIFPSEGYMRVEMKSQKPRGENFFGYMGDDKWA